MDNRNYLLGRQPILNRAEELMGYELLFRSADSLTAEVKDASQATASVILNTLIGFGIGDILGTSADNRVGKGVAAISPGFQTGGAFSGSRAGFWLEACGYAWTGGVPPLAPLPYSLHKVPG